MKAFMLMESRVCELPLSFARGMSPMFIHSYVKLATTQTNFSEQHFTHFLIAYGVFNTGLWKYECHSHVNVAPWDSVSTPGDELHLFSALFTVTSLDAAKDTAHENPYAITFNSTLSYEDAMLRAYVLPMEAILLSIDPIITPFSGNSRQQLSLVNAVLFLLILILFKIVGDELHLFSALFTVTSLDAAKDTAHENPYAITFNSTLSYEDAMLRAYVLPMEAILLSIDPIITPFSGNSRQQLSLVNVYLPDWASYYIWRGLCSCQSAASTAGLEQFNSPVAILLHWALTIYYILAYVLPKTSKFYPPYILLFNPFCLTGF
ncbi:hypothetical protein AHF37_02689 [Paragonimus kellicotti]|nr:hypothetical protein AHF37_02689 [Paragonimus kellicotti]